MTSHINVPPLYNASESDPVCAVVIFSCRLDQLLPHQPLHLPCDHCPIHANAVFSLGGQQKVCFSQWSNTLIRRQLSNSKVWVQVDVLYTCSDASLSRYNQKKPLFNGHVHYSCG